MTAQSVEAVLNLGGIFAFALSGALLAVRKDMDIIGIVTLASITGLGGGVIRDVLMGDVPPVALRTTWWLVLPLVATVVTFFFHQVVARLRRACRCSTPSVSGCSARPPPPRPSTSA